MNNTKILIVCDDPYARHNLYVHLTANHYDVFLSADGSASTRAATTHEPDLIVLVVGLPRGDGFTITERSRANDRLALVPVIVVSGRDRHTNEERSLKAGAKAFLQNPVTGAELVGVIRKILGESI
jgi:DNA-binding response OmpR family regulator